MCAVRIDFEGKKSLCVFCEISLLKIPLPCIDFVHIKKEEDMENIILWERRYRKCYYVGEKIKKILLYGREDIENFIL
jgi:hypothetical protein